jgi:chromosome segregation ATPase
MESMLCPAEPDQKEECKRLNALVDTLERNLERAFAERDQWKTTLDNVTSERDKWKSKHQNVQEQKLAIEQDFDKYKQAEVDKNRPYFCL